VNVAVCKNCGATAVRRYFHLRNSPLLQNVLSDRQEAALKMERLDCDFLLCPDCGLLYNNDYRKVLYSDTYDNDQTYSGVYQTHLGEVSRHIAENLRPGGSVLEIGCGNGAVLAHLAAVGFSDLAGFDPAHADDTPYIHKAYWRKSSKRYDCVILRHVLEGIDDFKRFLSDVTESIAETGFLYLEVTNARVLVEHSATATLYHECRQYFCEYSAAFALRQNGFFIHHAKHLMGGQILGIIARRVRQPSAKPARLEKLGNYKKIHIWGMSGRSIHFLTHHSIGEDIIHYGVDINPGKQGKYIPITGQKIISPAACVALQPDCIILLNANYLEEVRKLLPYPVDILTEEDLYCAL